MLGSIMLREKPKLCTTILSSSSRRRSSGECSYATRMLANSVSPPSGGTTRADSAEEWAGTGLKLLSLCQSWLPDW